MAKPLQIVIVWIVYRNECANAHTTRLFMSFVMMMIINNTHALMLDFHLCAAFAVSKAPTHLVGALL